jgi:hypothetical protein
MHPFFRASIATCLAALAVLACHKSTSDGGGSSDPPVSTDDCKSQCTMLAASCKAPPDLATQSCNDACDGTITANQLACFEGKSCMELMSSPNIKALCPADSSGSSGSSGTSGSMGGGSKQLGDACTCAGVSATAEGLCNGTDQECASGLSCIYDQGTSGKGFCMGENCCSGSTSACQMMPSLLKPCAAGTCKTAPLGFYCQK